MLQPSKLNVERHFIRNLPRRQGATSFKRHHFCTLKVPEETWLVIEKGAAKGFMGKPSETLKSLCLKPLFDCDVKYYFCREDFHPAPSVDAVLFHLKKKAAPDIPPHECHNFNRFVTSCLSVPNGIFSKLTKKQVSIALKMAGMPVDIPHSGEMLYIQWLCLFRCYMKYGKHKDYYIHDIHEDIVYVKKVFKKIINKYFIDNRPVDQVADELMVIIQNINANKSTKRQPEE